ncbi:MAG: molybdopterin molybdotransferase MoeA, partial [Bacteroidetes bacterium]|nr:molybdopterin molybdotransferase MoeA [Bacteroidota bacterium]
VIPVERVQNREGDRVSFNLVPVPGRHVRPAAEDVERGQQVFDAGELITPATLGMLATLGVDPVPVRRPPRVRIISTGDEIVEPSRQPVRGQIRTANGPALCAQVRSAGGQCPGHEHAFDSEAAIRECLFSGAEADLLVFSGGVSMGDHDHVRQVLESMGGVLHFWQVRQRPGKPLAFGLLGDQPFLGLPGNPVSSAMCFEIYVRPLIAHMLRRLTPDAGLLSARLDRTMDKVPDLHYFTRGTAWIDGDGMLRAGDTGPQGSNLYGSVVRANCIIHLPSDVERVLAGSTVLIQMLPWATLSGAPDTGVNP